MAQAIKDLGIKKVFLYPGGTIAPLLDELVHLGVEYICGVNEQGAGYGAIGAAKLDNKPQVVIVTSGPGATNLVSPVADAYYDSVPLIVITGQVGTSDINWKKNKRQTGFQETDTVGMYSSITKSSKILGKDLDLYKEINQAYNLSVEGRYGPVHLDLPMDTQRTETTVIQSNKIILSSNKNNNEFNIKDVINLIKKSTRPLILAGNGIYLSEASSDLFEFVEKSNIPLVSSMPAVGVIDTNNKMCLGYVGHTGEFSANLAMYYSDLLIVIGARLDVRQTGSEVDTFLNKNIIHIDIDKAEIEEPRVETLLKINCDCKVFLKKINNEIFNCDTKSWIQKVNNWHSKYNSKQFYSDLSLSSFHIIDGVSNILKNNKVIVSSGVGTHQQLVARYFNFSFPKKRWLTSAGHGTMGFDLPSAIGALIYDKSFDFGVVFVGDGSFQMNIQELANVVRYNLPLKIFVLDNNRLGIVSQFQLLNWETDESTGSKYNPSFYNIGKAYDINSFELKSQENVESILMKVFSDKRPSLIHCKIDNKEDVLPMLMGGQKMNEMYPFKNEVKYDE